MKASGLGRRLAGAALFSATLVIAVLAGVTPVAAAASLALSPTHGYAGDPFSASFDLGAQCPSQSRVNFTWDGASLGSAQLSDNGQTCVAPGVALTVPPNAPPGNHHVKATGVDSGGSSLGSSTKTYIVDPPASPSPTPDTTPTPRSTPTPAPSSTPSVSATAAPSQTPTPTAAPTATPTPADTPTPPQTPLPILDIPSFAPHDCSNGIPETTACPTASDALALGGSASPPIPPLTASSSGSHGGSSHTPLVIGGLVLLVGVIAVAGGWRAGTRPRRGLSRVGGAAPGRPRGPRRSG